MIKRAILSFMLIIGSSIFLFSCNKVSTINADTVEFDVGIELEHWDYYGANDNGTKTDFVIFDDADDMDSYFDAQRFVKGSSFDNQVNELRNSDFFDTKSLVCLIREFGTSDEVSIVFEIDGNGGELIFYVTHGPVVTEGLLIDFIFIPLDNSYIDIMSEQPYRFEYIVLPWK